MTNRFQKFAFSLISTRPHDTDTVADTGDRFRKFAFLSKTIHRFHRFRVDGT